MNSESGALAKIGRADGVAREEVLVARRSGNLPIEPKSPCCASRFCERNVPSPKNFCEKAKTEKPTVIGRFLMYGSVNENWNERWRLP